MIITYEQTQNGICRFYYMFSVVIHNKNVRNLAKYLFLCLKSVENLLRCCRNSVAAESCGPAFAGIAYDQ